MQYIEEQISLCPPVWGQHYLQKLVYSRHNNVAFIVARGDAKGNNELLP